jgi:glycosyltransferase involved in cell wall biosynthesis
LIAEDTPESFAGAIKQLFDDESLREELGRRGRELAESKLDWGFLAAGLERFYEDTLARFH